MIRKRLALAGRVLAGVLAVALILTAALPQGRTAVRTLLFLPQVVPSVPVKPLEWLTGKPSHIEVEFPTSNGVGWADLYMPAGDDMHGAVMLFLGVNPAGSRDARVVGLARGLARSGMAVMIPWSNEMTRKQVRSEEIGDLVNAYRYMLSHDRVDGARSGVGGFCVGASFVAIAAADPAIRDSVRFVNFFGGYYDARDLIAAVVSETRFGEDGTQAWTPAALSREVTAAHLTAALPDPAESELLTHVFVDKNPALDAQAVGALSSEAQAVHQMLNGAELDIEEARHLVYALPESMQAELRAISPSTIIDDLSARVLIMHDLHDELVPSEESRRLADALAERSDVYHTEFSLFDHLDPTRPVNPPVYAREMMKLYMHMYNVLRDVEG